MLKSPSCSKKAGTSRKAPKSPGHKLISHVTYVKTATSPKSREAPKRPKKHPLLSQEAASHSLKTISGCRPPPASPWQSSAKIKQLIHSTLNKLQQQKHSLLQQARDKKEKEEAHKKKLQQTNESIRKRNAKRRRDRRPPKAAWGVDHRQLDEFKRREAEREAMRAKVRSEREKSLKEGRARVGLNAYKPAKVKKSLCASQMIEKPVREANLEVIKYMRIRKQQSKVAKATEQLSEILKQTERERALYKLHCRSKQCLKPTKKLKKTTTLSVRSQDQIPPSRLLIFLLEPFAPPPLNPHSSL